MTRPAFAVGVLLSVAAVLLLGEASARIVWPRDVRHRFGEALESRAVYRPDRQLGADYWSYEDFQADNAPRLAELGALDAPVVTHPPDSFACVRKWIDFDLDGAFVGDLRDPALWVMLMGYGVAALVARRVTGAAPLPEVAARVASRPFARGILWGGSLGLLALAVLLAPGGRAQPFVYFQF